MIIRQALEKAASRDPEKIATSSPHEFTVCRSGDQVKFGDTAST